MVVLRADSAKDIAAPFLERACKLGGYQWQNICRKIDESHCQLWIVVTDKPIAALVTQATVDNVLECLIAGGADAKTWAGLAEQRFSAFAAENGLKRLRILGRKGWLRYFPHWSIIETDGKEMILERENGY